MALAKPAKQVVWRREQATSQTLTDVRYIFTDNLQRGQVTQGLQGV